MCGLVGVYSKRLNSEISEDIQGAINEIVHRGPDGIGYYEDHCVHLGHCRLAFRGTLVEYPITSYNERFVLGLNGEIYNYEELGRSIGLSSKDIKEGGDARVFVEYFSRFGEKSLVKFDGHFSAYIYDSLTKEIFLIRDRFGSKPLYYLEELDRVYFASEIKALQVLKNTKLEIDYQNLDLYLRTQNFYGESTIFRNVYSILPGEIVCFKNGVLRRTFFYSKQQSREKSMPGSDEIGQLILNSINAQWDESSDVSGYLSGGLDSSLIAIGAKKLGKDYLPVVVGFEDSLLDESIYAQDTAHKLGYKLEQIILSEDDFWSSIRGISTIVEEPRFGQCVNNLIAVRSLSNYSRIAMSGVGGDELFGGYPWRYSVDKSFANQDDVTTDILRKTHRLFDLDLESKITNKINRESSIELLKSKIDRVIRPLASSNLNNYSINASLMIDLEFWLPSLLLVEDKLAMSVGVETRLPFLSNALWEIGTGLPVRGLFATDEFGVLTGKAPLRDLAKQWGWNEISNRPKRGFSAPDNLWLKNRTGMSFMQDKNAAIWDYVDFGTANYFYDKHSVKGENFRAILWSFVYLNDFFNNYEASS
jgi:asparagine synthase (glutamine-hydrolysing)